MRKRLSVLLIMFILTLMLTALVSFAQTGDESSVPVLSTAVEENIAADGEDADPTASDSSVPDDTELSAVPDDPEAYKDEGSACDPEESVCGQKPSDPDAETEDSSKEDDSEDNRNGEQETRNETDSVQQKSRQLLSSEVTWHMNFSVDCVSSGCIALSDRSAGMYVSACNDGGGEYRSIEFTPVGHTGKFVSYYVTSGDSPSLGSANAVSIQNPSSSYSYGSVPVHTCASQLRHTQINTAATRLQAVLQSAHR